MRKPINKEEIKHIRVFDFDGTLVDSPTPEEGMQLYKQKTGKDWPHKGWWSKPESLDMEVFDISLNNDVIASYNKASAEPDTLLVLLTGRLPKLAPQVENILDHYGLEFDLYLYSMGGPTEVSKMKSLDNLLATYQNVESVSSWDDRESHAPHFEE